MSICQSHGMVFSTSDLNYSFVTKWSQDLRGKGNVRSTMTRCWILSTAIRKDKSISSEMKYVTLACNNLTQLSHILKLIFSLCHRILVRLTSCFLRGKHSLLFIKHFRRLGIVKRSLTFHVSLLLLLLKVLSFIFLIIFLLLLTRLVLLSVRLPTSI
jgi:hypothetical protein